MNLRRILLLPGTLVFALFSAGICASDFSADGNSDVLLRKITDGRWQLFDIDEFNVSSNSALAVFIGSNWSHQTNADFDGDGDADVLIRREDDGMWRLFEVQDGAVIGFTIPNLFVNPSWQFHAAYDFDSDGDADVLARKADTGQWRIFEIQNRNVVANAGVDIYQNAMWSFQSVHDYDGDGDGDVLLRKRISGAWRIFEVADNIVVDSANPAGLFNGNDWKYVTSGDMDKDDVAEIVLRNKLSGEWRIFKILDRAVSEVQSLNLYNNLRWEHAQTGDFDGAGDEDVLLRRRDDGRWRFFNIENRRSTGNSTPTLWQNPDFAIQGLVPTQTTTLTFDLTGFTEIVVPTVFNINVSQSPDYLVQVRVDTEVADRIEVSQTDSTLNISLVPGDGDIETLEAFVTMPVLNQIDLESVVGATLNDFDQAQMTVNVGGVSQLRGNRLRIDDLTVTVTGVSRLDFGDIRPIGNANIEISGVSNATLNMDVGSTMTGSVNTGQGTGTSGLSYYGTNVTVNVTTDEQSSIIRLGDTKP